MLSRRGNPWCHATIALPRDFYFDRVLRSQGGLTMAMNELNLAGLVVQKTGKPMPSVPFGARRGSRIVSGILQRRRGPRPAGSDSPQILLCGADGRLREEIAARISLPVRGGWHPGEG